MSLNEVENFCVFLWAEKWEEILLFRDWEFSECENWENYFENVLDLENNFRASLEKSFRWIWMNRIEMKFDFLGEFSYLLHFYRKFQGF